MVGQPEYGKGADDEQDEATALRPALELCTFETTDHGGVAGVDEGERHQAAHDGLKQILEDTVTRAVPVVRLTKAQGDVFRDHVFNITVKEEIHNTFYKSLNDM